MTTLDQSTRTLRELIQSCRATREGFRSAAEAAGSSTLKRLFALYAQQRSRFAEELGGFAASEKLNGSSGEESSTPFTDESELLTRCLEREASVLALYRKALADRTLPTKTHFLISAQLALLEQVHNRIASLRPAGAQGRVTTVATL